MSKLIPAALLLALTFPGASLSADVYDQLPNASMMPANIVKVSETVPGMGEHWADPATLPLGPIYCVHKGKIVCLEYMMAQSDYAEGKSWPMLKGMDGLPPVNHVDISMQPHGHEGFEVPHYDVHLYFLEPAEMAKVQP